MSIKINFDVAHNPEMPTIILAKKNGDKLGQINSKSIEISDSLNDASELTFLVHKYIDGEKFYLWDEIVDFKLIYCIEWDMWFEITVEIDEATETTKTVFCTSLGHAELSQINIYTTEINTENDITRDNYEPTVLFNQNNTNASLLHRIMEKAPHYTVIHVDETIANIQRTFTFDNISIYDALQKIAEELNCIFIFNSNSDENGNIQRTISVYDLESNCSACGNRGEFSNVCPECGSSEINEGYGEDTTIFVTSDELANNINLTTDTESIKNCFKLEAGDDLMTATIRNCNPNGSDYIWYITDASKKDMSIELVEKIDSYNSLYGYYQNDYIAELDSNIISQYNSLVRKYKVYNSNLIEITNPIKGYSALMNAYYNTIDLYLYLDSLLMPDATMQETNSIEEIHKLTATNLSPVSVADINKITISSANNAVLAMAKTIIDSRYKIVIESSELITSGQNKVWKGIFSVTNYSDETDCAESSLISIVINDNYETFVRQKLEKTLTKGNTEDLSISGLFEKSKNDFANELKKYSLSYLNILYNSCQGCIDILIEQGVSDKETWLNQNPNLYTDLYLTYYNKLNSIQSEIKVRQSEVDFIIGVYDSDGELKTYGLQNYISEIKDNIQSELNFENYLSSNLWLEFCSFKREDIYSNSNYISDGLDNSEIFKKANEFIQVAQYEIYKSSELQHKIESSLKNLLVIEKFKPLVKYFKVGNWIRLMVDDVIYKLRLIKYEIKYDNLKNISVEFSDVVKLNSSINSIKEVIEQAKSMATSYDAVKRQAKQGEKTNSVVSNWVSNGLNTTNIKIIGGSGNQTQTWDNHGMLFREYDSIEDSYDDEQIKIINSTISMTDDNWESTKTAFGKFYYYDPITNKLKIGFGINGELIIGKLLIGEGLGIYNESNTLTFNTDGLSVSNDINKVIINPNDTSIFKIAKNDNNVVSFDKDGNLILVGNITAQSLVLLDGVTIESNKISGLHNVAISGDYNDLNNLPRLSVVAISGSYNDLLDIPDFKEVAFTGSYNDLIDTPKLSTVAISGSYKDLLDIPVFATVATSGSYNDLINTPKLSVVAISGSFDDLLNKPDFKKVATSGSYNDLINTPKLSVVATSGSYNDLIDKPDISGIATNAESISNIMTQIEALNAVVFG